MPALLFGSISTLADTSELQRAAFNQAFEAHGLGWRWERDDYRAMLDSNGGQNRVLGYAAARGETVDAQAVHDTKSKLFQEMIGTASIEPRAGVLATIAAAKGRGWKLGLVTTTSRANVVALLGALAPEVRAEDFAVVVDADSVARPKPEPDAYTYAAAQLSEEPGACVAVEDNPGGVRSAHAAGVPCVAFPNANTAGQDFGDARVVEQLDLDDLAGTRS